MATTWTLLSQPGDNSPVGLSRNSQCLQVLIAPKSPRTERCGSARQAAEPKSWRLLLHPATSTREHCVRDTPSPGLRKSCCGLLVCSWSPQTSLTQPAKQQDLQQDQLWSCQRKMTSVRPALPPHARAWLRTGASPVLQCRLSSQIWS